MTEKTPSSSSVGARPSVDSIRSYSSAERPCCSAMSAVIFMSRPGQHLRARRHDRRLDGTALRRDDRKENFPPVLPADDPFTGMLGVRHQPEDVAASVANAGDRVQ